MTTRHHQNILRRSPSDDAAVRDYATRIGLNINVVASDSLDATPHAHGGAEVEWEQYTHPRESPPDAPAGTWALVSYEATGSPGDLPRTRYRMDTPVAPPFPIRNGLRLHGPAHVDE